MSEREPSPDSTPNYDFAEIERRQREAYFEYEQQVREKRHAFQMQHLSIYEIKRLNMSIVHELYDYDKRAQYGDQTRPSMEESWLEDVLGAAVGGLAEDGYVEYFEEVVNVLKGDTSDNRELFELTAATAAYYGAPYDYEFAIDVLVDRYTYGGELAADQAESGLDRLMHRVSPERAADLEARYQHARDIREAEGRLY